MMRLFFFFFLDSHLTLFQSVLTLHTAVSNVDDEVWLKKA